VIKASFGDRLDAWVHRLFPFLFLRPISPDALTVLGAVISIGAAFALAGGRMTLGGVLILLGGFCDLVDGVVARHQGVTTSFGAFLDSTLDRLVDMVLLLGLVFWYAKSGDSATALAASVVLVASVLTSYAKARAEVVLPSLEGGLLERGERIGGLAIGALFGVMVPMLWVLAAGTVFTVAQRFSVAYRDLSRMDRERPSASGVGDPV
jgi:CDP-diacylglycerol--glycerol-3-phosphate 3-phosphatidyltransferase